MLQYVPLALIIIVLLSWCIDYINGFHDTANAIATVVSTGVMPVRYAIIMAACLNFAGALMGTSVATAIAKGVADSAHVVPAVIIAALLATIFWGLLTWWFGIPSSTTHSLLGALAGAVGVHAGLKVLIWGKLGLICAFIIISPLLGFFVAGILIIIILWIVRRMSCHKVNYAFRKMQLVSAGAMAFTHGQNDAQKAMGIICLGLIIYGFLPAGAVGANIAVPLWVKLGCAAMMGAGTAGGGMRIIKTLGHKIAKLKPIHGFAAETAAAIVLFVTAHFGIPVSTTHSITGAIMGVGTSMNPSAVRWGLAGNIFVAWILTIPISALLSAVFYLGLVHFSPGLKTTPHITKVQTVKPLPLVTAVVHH